MTGKMDQFIRQYPKIAIWLFGIMLTVIGSMSLFIVNNNTTAMNELKHMIEKVLVQVHENKVDISINRTKIEVLEKEKERVR